MVGTDLEVGIRVKLPAEVEIPGSVLLPISRFSSILCGFAGNEIVLEASRGNLSICAVNDGFGTFGSKCSKIQLPSENPDEFPGVQEFAEDRYHEMPARFFREIVRRTVFAIDTESSRYSLGGVLVELTDDGITAVTTDGRRLARQEGPAKSVGDHRTGDAMTIIPSRAMQLIERALANNEELIQIAARDNDVLLKCGRATIYSRLVEGRYPKWRDVFPHTESTARLELNVGPFYAAVRQAAIVTSEDRRGVEFTFGDGKVVMVGYGAELGESYAELPVAYDGSELRVVLDPRYVSDFFRVIKPRRKFILELWEGGPVVFSTDDRYKYLLMGIKRDSNASSNSQEK